VAVYPQDGETVEALLQTADRELYGMKSRGAEKPSLSKDMSMKKNGDSGGTANCMGIHAVNRAT
jgi:hypothetical protein